MASDSKVPKKRPSQDSADIDGGWDEPVPPSRLPVSPVRGGTFRFGEERGARDASLPEALRERPRAPARGVLGASYFSASPVRGGTLSWDDLVAAAKRELPAKPGAADGDAGGRSWQELAAVARALGVEGVPDEPADELEALAVDQLLAALEASPARAEAGARATEPSGPEIVIEGEIDLATALGGVDDSVPTSPPKQTAGRAKRRADDDEA